MIKRRPARPIRVLIVDDRGLVRAGIRDALNDDLIDVVGECGSAEEAMDDAIRLRPDVILIDIDLPQMTGVQLVRELTPRLPTTRMVMLTVSTSERDLFEAVTSGATGYLTKDLSSEALLRAVRSAYAGDLAMPRRMAARLIARLVSSMRGDPGSAPDPALTTLTHREHEVIHSLELGLTDRQIAESLGLSPRTIETHVSNILRKLGVRNRAEAARRYRERV
jgi:DNA-binding NarL/FixJ family response regulator